MTDVKTDHRGSKQTITRRGDEELRACVVLRRGMRDVFDVTKLQAYLRRMERA